MKITFSSVLSIISFGVVLFSALILMQNQGNHTVKPVMFVTSADKSLLLEKMTGAVVEGSNESTSSTILIDSSISYQTMDGFGYTLTGGSAWHLSEMDEPERKELLQELYGNAEHAIRINYLRISIGASDLDRETYSYNDLPKGETNEELSQFDIAPDREFLIPILKEILKINPDIKILASPWSPPTWMKTFDIPIESERDPKLPRTVGGGLNPKYEHVYANYFVKYIQAMAAEGITIDAITIQNEPHHHRNNPSLYMEADQMRDFVKNHLGPEFEAAGIKSKIIIWDHNADRPEYPISILNDPKARKYIDGSAFHLYAGDIEALSTVKEAHQDKNLYFTEQYVNVNGDFGGDLMWHIENLIIGASRNWSKNVLQWNLTSNQELTPYTPFGGCSVCLGAVTIDGNEVTRNQGYYAIAHASKFIPDGSVRISSTKLDDLPNVAFKTPSNQVVMIILNKSSKEESINTRLNSNTYNLSVPANAVATVVF
jgi:glucosylceramidase